MTQAASSNPPRSKAVLLTLGTGTALMQTLPLFGCFQNERAGGEKILKLSEKI